MSCLQLLIELLVPGVDVLEFAERIGSFEGKPDSVGHGEPVTGVWLFRVVYDLFEVVAVALIHAGCDEESGEVPACHVPCSLCQQHHPVSLL